MLDIDTLSRKAETETLQKLSKGEESEEKNDKSVKSMSQQRENGSDNIYVSNSNVRAFNGDTICGKWCAHRSISTVKSCDALLGVGNDLWVIEFKNRRIMRDDSFLTYQMQFELPEKFYDSAILLDDCEVIDLVEDRNHLVAMVVVSDEKNERISQANKKDDLFQNIFKDDFLSAALQTAALNQVGKDDLLIEQNTIENKTGKETIIDDSQPVYSKHLNRLEGYLYRTVKVMTGTYFDAFLMDRLQRGSIR